MLTSDNFSVLLWHYLEKAQGSEKVLKDVLSTLPRQSIIDFYNEFRRAMVNLYDVLPDCSEDQRKDVAALIVRKGKRYYDEVLLHPEQLPAEIASDEPDLFNVTADVFLERFGEEISDL